MEMKLQMSIKHLSRSPQDIDENTWYYEESDGIYIVRYVDGASDCYTIPWGMIRKSLKRKNKNDKRICTIRK